MVVIVVSTRMFSTPKIQNPEKDNDRTHLTARKHDVVRNIHGTIVA